MKSATRAGHRFADSLLTHKAPPAPMRAELQASAGHQSRGRAQPPLLPGFKEIQQLRLASNEITRIAELQGTVVGRDLVLANGVIAKKSKVVQVFHQKGAPGPAPVRMCFRDWSGEEDERHIYAGRWHRTRTGRVYQT